MRQRYVLVVEDDKDINDLIAYNLRKQNCEVESAYDGREAQQCLQQKHYDIVVLDTMLPVIDGFSLCREIKDSPEDFDTKVIMLSARTALQDQLFAYSMGADYYVTKPFSTLFLSKVVVGFPLRTEYGCVRGPAHLT